jgi:hypothetical protein
MDLNLGPGIDMSQLNRDLAARYNMSNINKTKIYCHTKDDVPKTRHYAIITFSTYTIPGDERSRTNPGHGYPESTNSKADYVAYTVRSEWEAEVIRLQSKVFGRDDYVAMEVNPAIIKTTIDVKVETNNDRTT